jgi:p-hydroxybenzoate 3-monooxygenase
MTAHRTQVGIVGAGPAGLMLAQLLDLAGIDSVLLELRTEEHVVERVRAGVLEQNTVDLMREAGVAGRLDREGMRHGGIFMAVNGTRHHIDMSALTGGRAITVYGQNEVVKDLIAARRQTGRPLSFEVSDVTLHDLDTHPRVRYRDAHGAGEIACDFVAGCDGFHGVCRHAMPPGTLQMFERLYGFGWLGILAQAAPSSPELVYSAHDRGFALYSMRSSQITRLYLQCAPDEDLSAWPDDRIWSELRTRLATDDGWMPNEGPILQKSVTGMRSFVAEPMQHGRLFLAGDAAHIVPPTGAKGLNLAMADVWRLSRGLDSFYRRGTGDALHEYTRRALQRVWRAQRFSWWMTSMLHREHDEHPFDHRRRLAELEYLVSSRAAMTSLSENYVGAPLE